MIDRITLNHYYAAKALENHADFWVIYNRENVQGLLVALDKTDEKRIAQLPDTMFLLANGSHPEAEDTNTLPASFSVVHELGRYRLNVKAEQVQGRIWLS
jgi:hypothetical protein